MVRDAAKGQGALSKDLDLVFLNARGATMRATGSITALRQSPWPGLAKIRSRPQLSVRRAVQPTKADSSFFEKPTGISGAAATEISFGPFRLLPARFLLLEGDKAVSLGSRALEILTALLERRGELVSKQELMARVWPDIYVEPANLTVHISALRRTLRDGRDGNRFIINIPGRGYSFVASVEVSGHESPVRSVSSSVRPLNDDQLSL